MNKQTFTFPKSELYSLNTIFNGDYRGTMNKNFIEFCIRNKKIIEVEFEILKKMFEPTDEEMDYLKKEYSILKTHAKLTVEGEVSLPLSIPDLDKYNVDIQNLKNENVDIFNSLKSKKTLEEQTLKEEITIDLYTIDYQYIPESFDYSSYFVLRSLNLIITD